MAGRPTQYQKLSLRASADIKGLKAGVAGIRKEMRTLKGSMAAAQKQSNAFGNSMAKMAKTVGALFSVHLAGRAMIGAIKTIASFERQMSKIEAITRASASETKPRFM